MKDCPLRTAIEANIEALIGFFVNTLVLRTDLLVTRPSWKR